MVTVNQLQELHSQLDELNSYVHIYGGDDAVDDREYAERHIKAIRGELRFDVLRKATEQVDWSDEDEKTQYKENLEAQVAELEEKLDEGDYGSVNPHVNYLIDCCIGLIEDI